MDFYLLLKISVKVVNTVKNFLIMLNNLIQLRLKLPQKEQFKNQ